MTTFQLYDIWHSLEKQYSTLKWTGGKLLRQMRDFLEMESSHRMFPNQKQHNLKFWENANESPEMNAKLCF